MSIRFFLRNKIRSLKSLPVSRYVSGKENMLFFLSYMRSGHTLVSSLLNAHNRIVISNELPALRLVRHGFSSREIKRMIIKKDMEFNRGGREFTGYNYDVGYSEGHYRGQIEIIGNKHGPSFIYNFTKDFKSRKFLDEYKNKIYVIHHVRNPFDMVATGIKRSDNESCRDEIFKWVIEELKKSHKIVQEIKTVNDLDVVETHYDRAVNQTGTFITELLSKLNLEPSQDYLAACRNHVFDSPSVTRNNITWKDRERAEVERLCNELPFLQRYSGTLQSST